MQRRVVFKNLFLALGLPLGFLTPSIASSIHNAAALAASGSSWASVNDLNGDYAIKAAGDYCAGLRLRIQPDSSNGSQLYRLTSSGDNVGPLIEIESGAYVQEKAEPGVEARFTFTPIGLENGLMRYNISTPFDPYGKLDVPDGDFTRGLRLWQFDDSASKTNYAQIFYVEKNETGHYRFYVTNTNENNRKYYAILTYQGILSLSSEANAFNSRSLFDFQAVTGTYGLTSSLYRHTQENYDLNYALLRHRSIDVAPEDGDGSNPPLVGKPYSFGVTALVPSEGKVTDYIEMMEYNGTRAFNLSPSANLQINLSLNYNPAFSLWKAYGANMNNYSWGAGQIVGRNGDIYGDVRNWHIDNDDTSFVDESGTTRTVGAGLAVIQTSSDQSNWSDYISWPLSSDLYEDTFVIESGKFIEKGLYFRLVFRYRLYCDHDHCTNTFLGICTSRDTGRQRFYVSQVSEPFFVGFGGFYGRSFFPFTAQMRNGSTQPNDVDGFEYTHENNLGYQVGFDAFSDTGFLITRNEDINPEYSNFKSYSMEIRYNEGEFEPYGNYANISYGDGGRYQVKITNMFGESQIGNLYYYKNPAETFFSKPFSSDYDEMAFVTGYRMLAGKATGEIANLGIELPYSSLTDNGKPVPIFTQSAWIRTNKFYAPSATIEVKRNGVRLSEYSKTFDPSATALSFEVLQEGKYEIEFKPNYSESSGVQLRFKFTFFVIEETLAPFLNQELLYRYSQEVYDLKPTFYLVRQEIGPVTIVDGSGNETYKQKQLFYAMATYSDALALALRIEKAYVTHQEGTNEYYYTKQSYTVPYTEYEIFQIMYANAKRNIEESYFALSNYASIQGIYYTQEQISDFISTRTIADVYSGDDAVIYLIVTETSADLASLTRRQPFINNFCFVTEEGGIDSASVRIRALNGAMEYEIEYGIPVGQQLAQYNLPSGRYMVIETNAAGRINTYYAYYLAENGQCATTMKLTIGAEKTMIDCSYVNASFVAAGGFSLSEIVNPYDGNSLITVTYDREVPSSSVLLHKTDPYDVGSLDGPIAYTEAGVYQIHVEDRLGNYYDFSIEVREGAR